MKRRHRYKPYVRRANGRERTESFRMAIRLAFYRELRRPFFVMVQRGWPNLVMECGPTSAEVKQAPLTTAFFGFDGWANRIKRYAQGRSDVSQLVSAKRLCHKRHDLKRRRLRSAPP